MMVKMELRLTDGEIFVPGKLIGAATGSWVASLIRNHLVNVGASDNKINSGWLRYNCMM